ncbi:hypothetical protein DRP77_01645 [Candidatus Poribacteria bacterium]|nr:MAG: hypothetical protein DRP77_01645 [Candidatus Poribacteria bacterium]
MIVRIALPIITLLAAALRFWKLGEWSFWTDEALTVLDARRFPHIFRINPIPYAAVKLSTALFGEGEWSARLIPALFGIASVPLIYLIASRIFNRRAGLISSLLLAALPWHLFWSQNARSYSFALFWSLACAGCFYLAFERDSLALLICSLLSYLALVGSHLLSGALILGFVLYLILLWRLPIGRPKGLRRRNLLVFLSPFALACLSGAYPPVFRFITSGWGHNIWARSPLYILMTLGWGVTLPVAALSIYALLKTPGELNRGLIFSLCYAGAPLIFFLIGSLFQNVAGYYLFFTVPAYLMLAGYVCDRLWGKVGPLLLAIALLDMAAWDYLYFAKENGGRPMWREALELVRSEMEEGDAVVASVPGPVRYYLPEAKFVKAEDLMRGRAGLEGVRRAWFVLDESNLNVIDPRGEFRRWVGEVARFKARFSVYSRGADRSITVFLAPSPPGRYRPN